MVGSSTLLAPNSLGLEFRSAFNNSKIYKDNCDSLYSAASLQLAHDPKFFKKIVKCKPGIVLYYMCYTLEPE